MNEWCGNPLCERRKSALGYLWHKEEGTEPCATAIAGKQESTSIYPGLPASETPKAQAQRKYRFRKKALPQIPHLHTEQQVRNHYRTNPEVFYMIDSAP